MQASSKLLFTPCEDSIMTNRFKNFEQPSVASQVAARIGVRAIDEAVAGHVSQVYWDWRSVFDQDSSASPLQHPDYVLTEVAAMSSRHTPVIVGDTSQGQPLAVLLPKAIRTRQVGDLGPGWTMNGLRLVGGRFLGRNASVAHQRQLMLQVIDYVAASGASFLLIEDLIEGTEFADVVYDWPSHAGQVFVSHEFQPRLMTDFPGTAAEYWATFSSRSLSKFRRYLKKFGRTQLTRVTEIEQIPDFLNAAHAISQQSWQSRRYGLRIRNDENELRQLSALAQHGMLRSYLWSVNDKAAAFAICNQHRGCFRYEEIAYCAEFAQFSPGRTMLYQIVEDLMAHDSPRCLDFGGGDAEYKRQFANRQLRSGTVWLVPGTVRANLSLSYLRACRSIRATGRAVIKSSGLGTLARQWIRSRGADSASTTSDQEVTPIEA
jgi:CelD/BcsL family acetyltransferase involved in cellulose biosynthesis